MEQSHVSLLYVKYQINDRYSDVLRKSLRKSNKKILTHILKCEMPDIVVKSVCYKEEKKVGMHGQG